VSTDRSDPLHLLEPGALLGGPLFRSLAASTQAPRLPEGTRLGPFRIEAEIGAGGMGVVYRARRDDGQFDQVVAIKCVARPGAARATELFQRERQILASLRHPHIARLLDGGQHEDGALWFAMELVEGAALDAHARDARLDVAARLRLLLQVAGAVAFAHERLLLHRDLKPSNVLVDADGSVKLLDFGVSTLAGDADAARAYSPGWSSPEQRAGESVGPASDQYQLGLLLDALLRADPFAGDGPRRVEPAQWSLAAGLRRDELEAIARRATMDDPAKRYGSVREFADEIQRWLDRRPVRAHGAGLGYTLRRAVSRHPWATAAATAGLLALVAVVAGFSWRLAQERDRAEAEARTATAVAAFLQDDVLALADPNLSQDAGLEVRTLLERAAPAIDARFVDRPDVAGGLHATLGRGLRGLGQYEPARAAFARAGSAWSALPATDVRRLQLALWIGELDLAASRPRDAVARLAPLADEAALQLGVQAPLTLEIALRLQAARFEAGDQPAAIEALQALLPRIDAALGSDAPLAIDAVNRLSIMLRDSERLDEALAVRDEHLARARRAYGDLHSATLTGLSNRAVALRRLRRLDEAAADIAAAEDGLRRVFGFPSVPVLQAMNARSRILWDQGRRDEALAVQRTVLDARIALLGPQHDDVAYSHMNLGGMLSEAGRFADAAREFAAALAIREAILPPDHVDVIVSLALLSDATRLAGDAARAERLAAEALRRAPPSLAGRPELALAHHRHALALALLGRRAEALAAALAAQAIYDARTDTAPRVRQRLQELITSLR
jgi:serine/threonine-protein kinase